MPKITWGKKKGEKRLRDKEPKMTEWVKKAFLVRGRKTSQVSSSFLTDIVCCWQQTHMNTEHKHGTFTGTLALGGNSTN